MRREGGGREEGGREGREVTNTPPESEHCMAPVMTVSSASALQTSHMGREGVKVLEQLLY